MKARVIDKEVNAAWMQYYNYSYTTGGTNRSTDKVWILTYTEIAGHTISPNTYDAQITNSGNDGEEYAYFAHGIDKRSSTNNGGLVRGTYMYMWLASGWYDFRDNSAAAFAVDIYGSLDGYYVDASYGVVPAIRVA